MRPEGTRWRCIVALVCFVPALALASAHSDYMLHCMGCHLADGAGAPAAGIPRFSGRVGYFLDSPTGRAYLSQVPGAANAPLDDERLAEVLNWIVDYFAGASMPARFERYDAAEVHRYRSTRPTDIDALRRRLSVEVDRQQP